MLLIIIITYTCGSRKTSDNISADRCVTSEAQSRTDCHVHTQCDTNRQTIVFSQVERGPQPTQCVG